MRIYLDNSTNVFGHVADRHELTVLEREDPSLRGRLTIDADDLADYQADQGRADMRRQIEAQVADTASLLGTTADATALMLYHMAVMADGLSKAESLAAVRAAAQPFADLTAQFRADVDAGTVRLPHMVKGDETTCMTEISDRVTAVADVIQAAQGGAAQ